MRPITRSSPAARALLWSAFSLGFALPAFAQPRTIPIVADNLLIANPAEAQNASAGTLRSHQLQARNTYALFRFDLSAVRGEVVTSAALRLHREQFHLIRCGLSTLATPQRWIEGDADSPTPTADAPCFAYAGYSPTRELLRPWARGGSDIRDVSFGFGGSRWTTALPRYDPGTDWFEFPIPPEWINAMLVGLQAPGLLVSDDFHRAETYASVHARESAFPPELRIETRLARPEAASTAPPKSLRVERDSLGREFLIYDADASIGEQVVLCKEEPTTDSARGVLLPLFDMPAPAPGPRRALLSLTRSPEHRFVAVRAYDADGGWSKYAWTALPAPPAMQADAPAIRELVRYELPQEMQAPFTLDAAPALSEDGRWIRSVATTWWDPINGPIDLEAGRNESAAFQVVLAGAPGEYRVLLSEWRSPGSATPAVQTTLYRENYILSRLGREKYCPDPLTRIENGELLALRDMQKFGAAMASPPASRPAGEVGPPASAPTSSATSQPARNKVVQTIWVDLAIPRGAAIGQWKSRLIVTRDGMAMLDMPVLLNVVEPTLPDELSYLVSLQTRQFPFAAFGATDPSGSAAWALLDQLHRAAHAQRLTLVPIPYANDGRPLPGFAPKVGDTASPDGALIVDWVEWDRRFARWLDGSAFRGLPRDGAPLQRVVLPISEGWPADYRFERAPKDWLYGRKYHFKPVRTEYVRGTRANPQPDDYMRWPLSEAFSAEYSRRIAAGVAAFADHATAQGWAKTRFDILPLNLPGGRNNTWLRLSEPEIVDDARGLELLLRAAAPRAATSSPASRTAAQASQPVARNIARAAVLADPMVARDLLAGDIETAILSDAYRAGGAALLTRPDLAPEIWTHSLEGQPELGWSTQAAAAWADRLAGARGTVVLESLAGPGAWDKAQTGAYFYPPPTSNVHGPASAPATGIALANAPVLSTRLLALRRLQEDMELLHRAIASAAKADTPEHMVLRYAARILTLRGRVNDTTSDSLLPLLRLPGPLDTVVFEELRRTLRAWR
ncbi:MAG: hypothetical protein SF069_01585 [Phycisphaerae bacterium]|nr:hypothetical protein [Phycisphaerae bacterium]